VRNVAQVFEEEFPLPSEVEKIEPGEQVIPRTYKEYVALYGDPGKGMTPFYFSVVFIVFTVVSFLSFILLRFYGMRSCFSFKDVLLPS